MMKIVSVHPPNYDDIVRLFPAAGKSGVMFTFGDTIYAPTSDGIPPQLLVHEQVHSDRQGSDPWAWWERYLEDSAFRFNEELLAHQAEYAALLHLNRRLRQANLKLIARRLSSKLYGGVVSFDKAKSLIKKGAGDVVR